jgi:hypothetical protein
VLPLLEFSLPHPTSTAASAIRAVTMRTLIASAISLLPEGE